MKLAILGNSPLALEAALRFHSHGAALTLFNYSSSQSEFPRESFVTDLGLTLLASLERSTEIKDWQRDYQIPLLKLLGSFQKVRTHEVVSVTKRYLAPLETPVGGSRFQDLFRVIFQVDPQEFIREQKEQNPETYQRLTDEFVSSLQSNLEMYEDFDLVLDLRDEDYFPSLSITGRALGEGRITGDYISYGHKTLAMSQKISSDPDSVRELALLGSGPLAAEVLLNLEEWLKDQRSRLFVVTEEASPFEHYLRRAVPSRSSALKEMLHYFDQEFKRDINEFHSKLREWQSLDDFVQAKLPRPSEPIPRLVFFSGHNATAVDQLIDKRRLFITLEKPEFREGLLQPENNLLELKTIGIDRILVVNRSEKFPLVKKLRHEEIGHFETAPTPAAYADAWSNDLDKLKGIEDEIFRLFSPRDSH